MTTPQNPLARLLGDVKQQLHDKDPAAFHGNIGPGDCRCNPTAQPAEPAHGRSCDGGNCDAPSVGWRWYRDLAEWLPVCGIHMAGPAGPTRHYDTPRSTW